MRLGSAVPLCGWVSARKYRPGFLEGVLRTRSGSTLGGTGRWVYNKRGGMDGNSPIVAVTVVGDRRTFDRWVIVITVASAQRLRMESHVSGRPPIQSYTCPHELAARVYARERLRGEPVNQSMKCHRLDPGATDSSRQVIFWTCVRSEGITYCHSPSPRYTLPKDKDVYV